MDFVVAVVEFANFGRADGEVLFGGAEAERADAHFFVGLIAPVDGLRRVGVDRVARRIVEAGVADELGAVGNVLGLGELVDVLPVEIVARHVEQNLLGLIGIDGGEAECFAAQVHVGDEGIEIDILREAVAGLDGEAGSAGRTETMKLYARLCGQAVALAHARSGDSAMIAGYLGRSDVFDQAVAKFAALYADQTESDHRAIRSAVRDGRLEATTV